ncbi:hypothetical protein A6410_05095 [Prescottella equi]|nr:hypothetical protein A6410_05095 [Prescottella equi]
MSLPQVVRAGDIVMPTDELVVPLDELTRTFTKRELSAIVLSDSALHSLEGLDAEDDPGVASSVEQALASALSEYLPKGAEGKRLKSTSMVGDIVNDIGRPVTREEVRYALYLRFGQQQLLRYWKVPQNAINNALGRAVSEGLINQLESGVYGPVSKPTSAD